MQTYKTVFTTERGHRHQQAALDAAPEMLEIKMLRQPERDTLLAALADADFLISERTGVVDAEMIQAAPNLKLILRLGSLTYDIDTEAAQQAGVAVCYWPVAQVIRVAEHMLLQMLALSKKLRETESVALAAGTEWGQSKRTDEDTFAYNWSKRENVDGLWQKTIGVLGFGEIGAEMVRRLSGWGCRLLYHKRRRLPPGLERELALEYVSMDELLAESDYLCNLLPYFKQTDMLIDGAMLAKMKAGAALVSCGSGSVIDEMALAEAIRSGRLYGAALDTFEWEPIKADNPLIALAKTGYNVLLTPHIAAGAAAAQRSERVGDYTNIIQLINDAPLKYRVV